MTHNGLSEIRIPRIMIAAPSSGSGKTLLTCALLRLLRRKGIRAAAFKCGPDFIDPMFHKKVPGTPSRNGLSGGRRGRAQERTVCGKQRGGDRGH